MFQKSIFGNLNNNVKSIFNPVGNTSIPFYNNELKFTIEEYLKLNNFDRNINLEYNDEHILNIEKYLEILNILSNIEVKTKNYNIKLLLKISRNGLISTINAFGLNVDNVKLNIKNMILENRIDSILSNKNEYNTILFTENKYNLEKQFTLSPIFSYYISYFGIPEEGKGFNLDKIQIIKQILEENNINPYV